MKTEILNEKLFDLPNLKQDTLKAFKHYRDLIDSVEIDITEFIQSDLDLREVGYNLKYLEKKQVPFKTMLFTDIDKENSLSYVGLFKLTSRPNPLYELYIFDYGVTHPKDKVPLGLLGRITIAFNNGKFEFTYPDYVEPKDIDAEPVSNKDSEEVQTLYKELISLREKEVLLAHRLFELNSTFMEDFLYYILCAITYINDNRVFYEGIENPEEIDNKVLELVGDETRIIKIKAGEIQARYKLMNKRGSPRFHNVRGYFKRFKKSGKIIFVESYGRGDRAKGIITSKYVPQI